MVSISVFDTDSIGSNPFSTTNVGFSLTGKVPHCECGEQGSIPGVNQKIYQAGDCCPKYESDRYREYKIRECGLV